MTRVTLGKSRVRETCTPGSVRAKAEWLSYSTTTCRGDYLNRECQVVRQRAQSLADIAI
jgi:hypothetical protein